MIRLRSEQLLEGKMKAVMQEFGYTGGKAAVICKCGSPKEANEKARAAGLGSRWFLPDCCEEVKEGGVDLYKDVEMAVCVDGKNYLNVDEIRDRLLR